MDGAISQHAGAQGCRAGVRHHAGSSATGTALDSDDNFLRYQIKSAVACEGSAWESLAPWGQRWLNPLVR